DGRQRAAEAPQQIVVAAAAADRGAEGRVVDVEHGARVVADVAHEPEVEDHALGGGGLEQIVDALQSGHSLLRRGGQVREDLGTAASLGNLEQQVGRVGG